MRRLIPTIIFCTVAMQSPGVAAPRGAPPGGDAQFAGESAFLTMRPGDTGSLQVFFANTGSTTWIRGTSSEVVLGVCVDTPLPQGFRCNVLSPYADFALNWTSPRIYAVQNQAVVSAGSLATFTYNVRVPLDAAMGDYYFRGELMYRATPIPFRPVGYHHVVTVIPVSTSELPIMIAVDNFTNADASHSTIAEPDTYSHRSTVIAVFQAGRFSSGGGATAIGYARSADKGKTWTTGFLRGVTASTGGTHDRATDPTVTYDAKHGVWLASSLRLSGPFGALYPEGASDYAVSISSDDGVTWSDPPAVAAPPLTTPTGYRGTFWTHDQGWIACDNSAASRYYGRCYLGYVDTGRVDFALIRSDDGGTTWSAAVHFSGGGPKLVVRPNGDLVSLSVGGGAVRSSRSVDGGATFEPDKIVGPQERAPMTAPLWDGGVINTDVASADGRIFVAWEHCGLRPSCAANDIVFSSSSNGTSWSTPQRIPLGSEHFVLPGLAVDSSSSGGAVRLALTYYYMAGPACDATCRLRVGFVFSTDAGATWSEPRQIDRQAAEIGWHAPRNLDSAYFVGDYISTSFAGSTGVAVFALANAAPSGGVLAQPLWALPTEIP
jgi:hypothetical protein